MARLGRVRNVTLIAPLFALACGPSGNSVIERACRTDGEGSAPVCACIQDVADRSLSASDQRRAATFFADPQSAQDTRQSSVPGDDAFWDRYYAYARQAERICG